MPSPKIKIVYAICSLGVGGAERMLVDLVNALDRSRFDPYIICLKERGALAEDLISPQPPVFVIGKRSKLGIAAIFDVYRILKKIQPQILHTHLFCGDLWCRIAGIFARVPAIISTEHNLHTLDRFIERASKRLLNHWTRKIIFVSTAVKEHYQSILPLAEQRAQVIPNGVPIKKYTCSRVPLEREIVTFISIARLTEPKGLRYFLQALAEQKAKPWHYRIAGEGEERQRLEALTKELGLLDRVEFLGTRLDVRELLSQSDVFVLPSLYEGQGISLLEAAASGCLLLASRVDGIAEMFDDKTALLTAPGDASALSSAVSWIFEHRNEARILAHKAQETVYRHYDLASMTSKYERLYIQENTGISKTVEK